MNYQKLENASVCYRCKNKEICKIVYQADDCGIQRANWDCSHFTEPEPLKDREFLLTVMQSVMSPEQVNDVLQNMVYQKQIEWKEQMKEHFREASKNGGDTFHLFQIEKILDGEVKKNDRCNNPNIDFNCIYLCSFSYYRNQVLDNNVKNQKM